MSDEIRKRGSLQELYPDIAGEWHPSKNGGLMPDHVTAFSEKKVWWYLPYDDPETGKHFDFEWEAEIKSRTKRGFGCPYLTGRKVWPGFNDLKTKYPELSAEWHPTKNGSLTPEMITVGTNKKVWWYLPYDDPETGKHFDFEWLAPIASRTGLGTGCPYLAGEKIWPGFNDLKTKYPELSAEWHPTKNGSLTPEMVTAGSKKKVWWYLPYDDPETGKHFDFEWLAVIKNRTGLGIGCPYLTGKKAWPGFNDLKTKYPELSAEWHPTKNGSLTPEMVTAGSQKKVWWYLPYDDPETGKHFDFEWLTNIVYRSIEGAGCPYLEGKKVWSGFNDLVSSYPDIATQWDCMRNDKSPEIVHKFSPRKYWWKCPICGRGWLATVRSRTVQGTRCPNCKR